MATKASAAKAREAVRIIITKETPKGPRATHSIPANLEGADLIAARYAAALRAAGHTVTVATVTMALV